MIDFFHALIHPEVPFIRYAFIVGLLSSIPFGIIGTVVVVNRMTYIAGALSHTALGGIGLALWLSTAAGIGFVSPMVGALVVSLVSGLIIAVAIIKKGERLDTVIGTIWAVGMSVGLICIHITPGYQDPMSYLFGNILLISQSDLLVIIVLNVMIILTSVLFHNQFLAVFFDEEFARLRGTRTAVYHIMLIVLVSLTVILMITIIGIVMVIALLTIPAAIAGMFAKRMKAMMVAAVIICALIMMSGLAVSYLVKLPTGSVTVVLAGATYVLAKLGKRLVR